jgi:regulator of sigma E protease
MSILIFIIILLVLVVSHEFGHFIVAKKSGIRVDEFAFGMKPRLFSIKRGEIEYSINALPIGGYVKIFGENPDEESIDGKDKERSMVHKSAWTQAAVLIAGVAMNFLIAWLLLSIGFISGLPASVGTAPKNAVIHNQALTIVSIAPHSPAEGAALRVGDKLQTLTTPTDRTEVPSVESIQYFVKRHSTEPITVSYIRGSQAQQATLVPEQIDGRPAIGISMDMIGTVKLPVHIALWEGLKLSCNVFVATVVGFYNLIHDALTGNGSMANLTGPVGIVGVVGQAAEFGFIYLLSFTAFISLNLAVINLVPFPALDGGRLLFLLIEKIKGSRIKPAVANTANAIGFGLLMILMVVITYHDIVKLIRA